MSAVSMGKRKQTENKSSLEIVKVCLWGNAGGGGIVFASGHGTDGHSEGGTVAAAEPEQGDLGQILPLGDEESGPASLHALAAAWPLPTWQSLAKPPMELHLPHASPLPAHGDQGDAEMGCGRPTEPKSTWVPCPSRIDSVGSRECSLRMGSVGIAALPKAGLESAFFGWEKEWKETRGARKRRKGGLVWQ